MIGLNQLSGPRLFEYNRQIAQWERLSGTPTEREAAQYIEHQLKQMGCTTQLLIHDAFISLPGRAALRVIAPNEQELFCITHSMVVSTPPEGIRGEVRYAARGTHSDLVPVAQTGSIALVDGRATAQLAADASAVGVQAVICISGRHAHESCCSPVWGNPSSSTVDDLPSVPIVSLHQADGEALRDLCQMGRVEVQITTQVKSEWTQIPIVVADLSPGHPEADDQTFVLFSGHLDSWYHGAMDNGSANACMLEVAALMAQQRAILRRGLRLAFWSGHSHGRYASSAWYADHYWFDLEAHCVMHVNVDSIGAVGHDDFSSYAMAQTFALGDWAVQEVVGKPLRMLRMSRNADQSFWGIGIPSLFGSLSRDPHDSPALGWWWHTPHDTMDKIDPDRLVRDSQIFALTLNTLLTSPVLPLDYAAAATDIKTHIQGLAESAQTHFDLTVALEAATRLEERCTALNDVRDRAVTSPQRSREVNALLQELGHLLIPTLYCASGRFVHDPALDLPFLPRLAPVQQLAERATEAAVNLLRVDLVRARNELVYALNRAADRVQSFLAQAS